MQKQRIQVLTDLLLDINAESGDRDDAAMLLAESDDPKVVEVLIEVTLDESTDSELAETCGESLGEIWSRKRNFYPNNFHNLRGMPLLLALGVIETRKPQWREDTQTFRKQLR